MNSGVSIALILLFAGQQGPRPFDAPVPAGQRTDGLVLVAEEVFQAQVSVVLDGDSVLVQDGLQKIVIRVQGVDAPESSQRFGYEAAALLRELLGDKTVTVRRRGRKTESGETIARVEVNGADVSRALISNGLAWRCDRFAEDRGLASAETAAKNGRRGLWQDASPTPPWKHRGAAECWEEGTRR